MSRVRVMALLLAGVLCVAVIYRALPSLERWGRPDPVSVRAAARAVGLDTLARVTVPAPGNLHDFIRDTDDGRAAARQLGKALFWDMQVGSDGQACASCHFHAGADNRTRNQLNPGTNAGDATFGNPGTGIPARAGHPRFGVNHELQPADFPFHGIDLCGPTDFSNRIVLTDTNDVASSQGVFFTAFTAIIPGASTESGTPVADPVFHLDGTNVRGVEPRHAPTIVNAVFNVENFWDGRARSEFNGSNSNGTLDPDAGVFVEDPTHTVLTRHKIAIDHSSLASQSLSPPLSSIEMSFDGRTMAQLGKKMFSLRPLGLQRVSPHDSVLGSMSRATSSGEQVGGDTGLNTSYSALISRAFQPQWWNSSLMVDGLTQMEANFSLFFGLAVQAYESLLVSDRTPFVRFMEGDDAALSDDQLRGLLSFIKTPFSRGRLFRGVGRDSCVLCHAGPELTAAAYMTYRKGRIRISTVTRLEAGVLVEDQTAGGHFDQGFFNTGVRPTGEDVGRGAELREPLSFTRAAVAGLPSTPPLPACGGAKHAPCAVGNRDFIDGAFKVPGLRNVELTGPYFHNGGQATLRQVLDFYRRQGDFVDRNAASVSPFMAFMDFEVADATRMVQFLLGLTDERVRQEQTPFDHPQLFVPNGSPKDFAGVICRSGAAVCDSREEIPATGAGGRVAAGLPPLGAFLQLDPESNLRADRCPRKVK